MEKKGMEGKKGKVKERNGKEEEEEEEQELAKKKRKWNGK